MAAFETTLRELTAGQLGIWYAQQLAPDNPAYNTGEYLDIRGELDLDLLAAAARRALEEAEAYRSRFRVEEGTPRQYVADARDYPVHTADLSGEADPQAAAEEWMRADLARSAQLAGGPLTAVAVFRLGPDHHLWYQRVHHIAVDGCGLAVFARRVAEIYTAFAEGRGPEDGALEPVSVLLDADRAYRESDEFEGDRDFWRQALAGFSPAAAPDGVQARQLSKRPTLHQDDIDGGETRQVREAARRWRTGFAGLAIASAALYHHRTTGERDIVLGVSAHGRTRRRELRIPGMAANILPVRIAITPGTRAGELVRQASKALADAVRHQRYQYSDILGDFKRVGSGQLYGLIVNVMPFAYPERFGAATATRTGLSSGPAESLKLVVCADAAADRTQLIVETNPDLHGPTAGRDISQRYRKALAWLAAASPADPVGRADLLDEQERRRVLTEWNSTDAGTVDGTVADLFASWAERTPDATAVVCDGVPTTYRELNERANRLAGLLRGRGIGAESVVALALPRGVAAVVAILAVWKAGAAYLPLDPQAPAERSAYLLRDSRAALLIATEEVFDELPATRVPTLVLDAPAVVAALAAQPATASGTEVRPGQLAYVIYTSGSTGRPKGVAISHGALANYVAHVPGRVGFGAQGTRSALLQAQATDLGNTVLFGSLTTGGELHVLDADAAVDPAAVAGYLADHRIEIVKAVPSHLAALGAVAGLPAVVPAAALVLGGEAAEPGWAGRLLEAAGERAVFNHYGPTEATIGVATGRLDAATVAAGTVPLGTPVPNTRLYVLDDALLPVPPGVLGELYIAGAQLARGYQGRPALTAERFTACPFGTGGGRMYRTGDRARWDAEGRVVFAGRADEQVKIRGFRVEPGEARAAVAAHPRVGEAVVVVREDSPADKQLVAYVVPTNRDTDDDGLAGSVRAFTADRLPSHLVPAAVVVLDTLPLTANGKVDRAALPAPHAVTAVAATDRAPATPREELVREAFAQVLGLPVVGVDDDFFTLGGHSLLAVSLVERLRTQCVVTSVRELFQTPTPASLAAATGAGAVRVAVPPNLIPVGASELTPEMLPLVELDEAEIARIVAAVPGGAANVADVYPLAPLQEGIFFHHLARGEGDADVYMMSAVLGFDSRARLGAFLTAFQNVVDRHDIYRTAIMWEGLREPVQVVHRQVELPVTQVALSADGDPVRELLDGAGSWLELNRAPLLDLRTAADPAGDGRWLALLRMHHLVRDHTTLEVLFGELRAFTSGRGDSLPEPLAFREFVAQARLGIPREEHERFFAGLLGDVTETTAPYGLLEVHHDGSALATGSLPVDDRLAGRVRELARTLAVSPATLFHLAWARTLGSLAGRDDVVFGTVLLGRMTAGAGADRVAGPFLNTLPVRVRLDATGVADAVAALQRQLAELFEHEHAPLAVAQKASGVRAGSPLFTSIFNYRHHQTVQEADLGLDGVGVRELVEFTNYPLNVAVSDTGSGFVVTVHAPAPHDPARVFAALEVCLENLVTALVDTPDTPLTGIDTLSTAERQLLAEWNATTAPAPDLTVPELIARQTATTPDAGAAVCDGTELRYAELDAQASRLAHYLRGAGVGPESVVGLCLPRGVDLLVAVLGIWRAGAAYLPIDPGYPPSRIAFMLEDSRAALLVGTADVLDELPVSRVRTVDLHEPAVAAQPATAPELRVLPDQLAYVIYTSGSTGLPKGVVITHGGLANYVTWAARMYGMDGGGGAPLHSSPAFDLTLTSMLLPLVSGSAVVLSPEGGAAGLAALLRDRGGFGLAKVVPGHLPLLGEMLEEHHAASAARRLVVGGEPLGGAEVRAWLRRAPETMVVNEYGPTEAVVGCCVFEIASGEPVADTVPIGRPVPNTRLYVLDDALRQVPVGATGELYIAGAQLARGYAGRPGLTSERFVACPFETGRMYRTGDLARWTPDGQLVFAGRVDEQAKIRGFRVEPGEVEAVVAAHPGVSRAAVVVREDIAGDRRLVAYVVPVDDDEDEGLGEAVRGYAAERLPDHLVPAAVVSLADLPLTFNGKLDRDELPAPEYTAGAAPHREPADRWEKAMCEAFAEVLAVPVVGVDDDFFALGGHSLLATRLVSRVRTLLDVELPIQRLFETSTPAGLAAWIAAHNTQDQRTRPVLRPMRTQKES